MPTENSVRSENSGFTIIREMIFLSTMNSFLVALFALITCSFRTRAALQTEILAIRHRIAVLQANAPRLASQALRTGVVGSVVAFLG